MKKLVLISALVLSSIPFTAAADDQIFVCTLTGFAYQSPMFDSLTLCMDNCFEFDAQGNQIWGDCFLQPPGSGGSGSGTGGSGSGSGDQGGGGPHTDT